MASGTRNASRSRHGNVTGAAPVPAVLRGLFVVFFLALTSMCGSDDIATREDTGLKTLSAWNDVPVLHNYSYQQFSSYDRKRKSYYPALDPGNKDFNNFIAVCGKRPELIFQEIDDQSQCEEGREGYLIASTDNGPGYVSRIWLTTLNLSTLAAFEDEVIRVYADDPKEPAYEGKISAWQGSINFPFVEPFAGLRSGSMVSYVPISFSSRLRIFLDNLSPLNIYYYQVDMQHADIPTVAFATENFRNEGYQAAKDLLLMSGKNPNTGFSLILNEKPVTLPAGHVTDILHYNGKGTVELLGFTFHDVALAELQNLALMIFWDGRSKPAVNVPLSAFYGCHLKIAEFHTLPVSVKTDGGVLHLSFFLPMPFSSGALMRVENRNPNGMEARVTIGIDPDVPDGQWGHFHSLYHSEEAPIPAGSLYQVISVEGQGKYAGTFMFLEGHEDVSSFTANAFNFLEGDETGIIDDRTRMYGTGTEDYFNGGFYFSGGEYGYPFSGINLRWDKGDGYSSAVSVHRWHVLTDEINFHNSFTLQFEYGANKPDIADRYSSVAYFYLAP